jgi:hypothetical protein
MVSPIPLSDVMEKAREEKKMGLLQFFENDFEQWPPLIINPV